MGKWFYEKNTKILEHPVNKTFEEILWMSDADFRQWVADMRQAVVEIWDNDRIPPRIGYTEEEIIEQFNKISSFPVHEFLVDDLYADTKRDVIRNTSVVGNAANQWFPTMMKTKINYTSDMSEGLSIYDHFKNDDLLEKMIKYARRHFKRDSFYHYSFPVPGESTDERKHLFSSSTGAEWIRTFEERRKDLEAKYDYWIGVKDTEKDYTGYNDALRGKKWLTITDKELNELPIPDHCKTNLAYNPKNLKTFQIRVFEKGQRLFPPGLKAFRVSVCQYAVNFPPLTAKFLYERCIEKMGIKEAVIWDPSSGWGGRILGAMGVRDEFKVHYIGTDPNTDHNTENGRTKYHELADFFNTKTTRASSLNELFDIGRNTYEIYQCGSETMHEQPGFQRYKGKIDIVFTSPPYFGKELYSDDPEQSASKFNQYDAWRDGFLKPTLKTAVEWLKPGGFLLWNIADAEFGDVMLPLETDSCTTIEELGMIKVETLKMALAQMPGGNRVDVSDEEKPEPEERTEVEIFNHLYGHTITTTKLGTPSAKNFCRVEGSKKPIWLKYEPIFVYQKPAQDETQSLRIQDSAHPNENIFTKVKELATDFLRSISGDKINPNWIRAIYTALQQKLEGLDRETIIGRFNANEPDEKPLYLVEIETSPEKKVLLFAEPKMADRGAKVSTSNYVLVQLLHETQANSHPEIALAWGRVKEVNAFDATLYVEISDDRPFAEKFIGHTVPIEKAQIIRVSKEPIELLDAPGTWRY